MVARQLPRAGVKRAHRGARTHTSQVSERIVTQSAPERTGCVRRDCEGQAPGGTTYNRRGRGGHEKHQPPATRTHERWARPLEGLGAVDTSACDRLLGGPIRFSFVVEFPTDTVDVDGCEIVGGIFGGCAAAVDHVENLIHRQRGRSVGG